MISWSLIISCLVLVLLAAVISQWLKLLRLVRLVRKQTRGDDRDFLWNLLYGLNWQGTTTNNYGFAPAQSEGPERFQFQMYYELVKLHLKSARKAKQTQLLEVSCGQGGGLVHVLKNWPSPITAIGLDKSHNAIASCQRTHASVSNLRFVQGDALDLPFPDGCFDVVVNVEAAGDYGNLEKFYSEVHRVLRAGGAFLYTDTCRDDRVETVVATLKAAGFRVEFRDIGPHVVQACEADSPRRRGLIEMRVPLLYRWLFRDAFENYAAIEGSKRFAKLQSGRLRYPMFYAVRQ